MKIAILGYDVEGRSSFKYFADQGHELTICDRNPDLKIPEGVPNVLGEHYLDDLDRFDLLVRTAGLPPHAILDKNPGVADKITSHVNEFMKACPTPNVIGVTGTKGKGTTSTMIAKMLATAGMEVRFGGNVGVPPLGFLSELTSDSWVVLELSSFQLIDLKISPHIGVCLMVVPEHLDWHPALDDYIGAKSRLFVNQSADDVAIYFAGNATSKRIAEAGQGREIPYYAAPGAYVEDGSIQINGHSICKTDELELFGKHNWQNVCAAVTAAWQVTHNEGAIRLVLTSFGGLEHRLQLVRELDGVGYYDDSFGTAPETAMVAIEAFERPVIAILGGRSKGIPFDHLAEFVAKRPNVERVIAIGETGPEIAGLLRKYGYDSITEGGKDIETIVRQAREAARPGSVVLLSTGCASFDMFENYKRRGELFTEAVQALA